MADQTTAPDAVAALLRTPPPEFIVERKRIVKQLRTGGDRELAATVAAVRKPGLTDWSLNVTAAEDPDAVTDFAEAANDVIEAQEAAMEGREAGDLRVRLKLLRVCTAAVASVASSISSRSGFTGAGSAVGDVTTRLTEIAANKSAVALLLEGRLGAEDPGIVDPFGEAESTGPASRRARDEPAGAAPRPGQTKKAAGGPTAEERRLLRTAVADANKALAAAESAAETARRSVAQHERSVATAQKRVSAAETHLEEASESLATDVAQLEAARLLYDSNVAAVDAAHAALDGLDAPG